MNIKSSVHDYFNAHTFRKLSGKGDIVDYIKCADLAVEGVQGINDTPGVSSGNSEQKTDQSTAQDKKQPSSKQQPAVPQVPTLQPPSIPEPGPFGIGSPDTWWYHNYSPTEYSYLNAWKRYQQAQRFKQQAVLQAHAQASDIQQKIAAVQALLQLFGIGPEQIQAIFANLFKPGTQKSTKKPSKVSTAALIRTNPTKKASAVLDAINVTLPYVGVGSLAGGGLGTLYGLYKYYKTKKTKRTVPSTPVHDMLYGFIAGALLGGGGGMIYGATKDVVPELFSAFNVVTA